MTVPLGRLTRVSSGLRIGGSHTRVPERRRRKPALPNGDSAGRVQWVSASDGRLISDTPWKGREWSRLHLRQAQTTDWLTLPIAQA
jgi:hypothetical protein